MNKNNKNIKFSKGDTVSVCVGDKNDIIAHYADAVVTDFDDKVMRIKFVDSKVVCCLSKRENILEPYLDGVIAYLYSGLECGNQIIVLPKNTICSVGTTMSDVMMGITKTTGE